MSLGLAIAGLLTNVVSTGASLVEAKSATQSMEEAQAITKAQQKVDSDARRAARIREQRIKQAGVKQKAVNTGVVMSSGLLGATGAMSTNLGASLSTQKGQASTQSNIQSQLNIVGKKQEASGLWQQGADLAKQIGITAWERI